MSPGCGGSSWSMQVVGSPAAEAAIVGTAVGVARWMAVGMTVGMAVSMAVGMTVFKPNTRVDLGPSMEDATHPVLKKVQWNLTVRFGHEMGLGSIEGPG